MRIDSKMPARKSVTLGNTIINVFSTKHQQPPDKMETEKQTEGKRASAVRQSAKEELIPLYPTLSLYSEVATLTTITAGVRPKRPTLATMHTRRVGHAD